MIALGIDAVDIARFDKWSHYAPKTLERIFSREEIAYCLECPAKSAERFAVRFALKEAFYKALCAAYPDRIFSFFLIAQHVHVVHAVSSSPRVAVDWQSLNCAPIRFFFSMSHAKTIACATVIFE